MSKKKDKNKKKDENKYPKESISFKHDKEGLKIYVNIYNTNNLANQGSNAGVKQKASEGSQNLTGKDGENASQGGQIADKGSQNANQFGQVAKNGGKNKIKDAKNKPGSSE
ncbi:hypothetical protein [Niallia nealsonii]|uniref:Uncharacterized protein n=1 Tax=Niallia nealsonii TaxID=115979 RepID=A0A2N0Z3A9_9BACI|nr:hypothetical protein [Niallia nealsonii]PKG23976.1 hypothetical protein CWS01_09430 [Niallia nealsonii]